MPITEPIDRERLQQITELLDAIYGRKALHPAGDALGELIGTILSQSTTDSNSGHAYRRLRERFPTWQAALEAPTAAIYEAIRPAGLGNIKAPRIQRVLEDVLRRHGELNLDFLRAMPLDDARRWLLALDGVGPKTAACVLLFALGMPAMPVDTHVHRVTRRLGLLAPSVSAEKAHALLEAATPPDDIYTLHINLIQHGKRVCHAQRPACGVCQLAPVCPSASSAARSGV